MILQFLQYFCFDLSNTFSGDIEFFSHFFQGMSSPVDQSESHLDDLLFSLGEVLEHVMDVFFQDLTIGCFRRGEGFAVFDKISKSRVFFCSDWCFEGNDVLRDFLDMSYLSDVHIHFDSDFFWEWFTSEFLYESSLCMSELVYRLNHMDGDSDCPGLVGDRSRDRLSYPPCSIGREFETSPIVKFLNSTEESYVSFLDEVEE